MTYTMTTQENDQHISEEVEIKISTDTLIVHGKKSSTWPLRRFINQWAYAPNQELLLSLHPRITLSSSVNVLLKKHWVEHLSDAEKQQLNEELAEEKRPSAELIRKVWAAQGSAAIIKMPRADVLKAVLAGRGWSLYKGVVHTVENLGDILSDDVIAVITPSTKVLRLYQITEHIKMDYHLLKPEPKKEIKTTEKPSDEQNQAMNKTEQ